MNQFTNKYSEKDYIQRCNILGVDYVGTRREKKKGVMIRYVCPKHKEKGIQETDWSHFRVQKKSCPFCYGRKQTTEEFHASIKNQKIIFLSDFQGTEKPLKCLCQECGNIWVTNSPKDLRRRNGCPVCGNKKKGEARKKTQEEFEKDLFLQNPNIRVIGKYSGAHKLVKCKCIIDGYEWSSYACNLLNGSAGCYLCNNSTGENEIIEAFTEWGINYETQYTVEGCKNIFDLRFDAYDRDNNVYLEFQGEQHFFPVDFAGKGKQHALEELKRLQERDKMKKDFCEKNNLSLICIPYWFRGNVKQCMINNCSCYQKFSLA